MNQLQLLEGKMGFHGDRDTLAVSPAEPLAHTANQNLPRLILTSPALCLNLTPLISEGSLLTYLNSG